MLKTIPDKATTDRTTAPILPRRAATADANGAARFDGIDAFIEVPSQQVAWCLARTILRSPFGCIPIASLTTSLGDLVSKFDPVCATRLQLVH